MENTTNPYQEETLKILEDHYGINAVDVSHNITTTNPFCATIKCHNKGCSLEKYIVCKVVDINGVRMFGQSLYDLDCQAKIMAHLFDNGIQCSRPVPTLNRKLYCEAVPKELQGKVTFVLEHIPGKSLNFCDITLETLQQIGEWIAHIQQALKNLRSEGMVWSPDAVWQNENGDWALKCLPLLDTEEQRQFVTNVVTQWKRVLRKALNDTEIGVMYPSLHLANIIAVEGKEGASCREQFGLIDFENMRCSLVLWAVAATMLLNSCMFNHMEFDKEDVWKHILLGYNKVVKLSYSDLELIYHIMCQMQLVILLYGYKKRDADPVMFAKYLGDDFRNVSAKNWRDYRALLEMDTTKLVQTWVDILS